MRRLICTFVIRIWQNRYHDMAQVFTLKHWIDFCFIALNCIGYILVYLDVIMFEDAKTISITEQNRTEQNRTLFLHVHTRYIPTSPKKENDRNLPKHSELWRNNQNDVKTWREQDPETNNLAKINAIIIFEPPHDKTNKWFVHLTKSQISLGVRPLWSDCSHEESLGPKLPIEHTPKTLVKAHSENPDQSAQRRLWSDWANAQADLSLRWAHMPFCWFCHEAAHIFLKF